MGRTGRAKTRYGAQIKNYMSIYEQFSANKVYKAPLELEAKKPSPGSKPRNPNAHPWRYTGQAKGRIFKDIDPVPFDRKIDVPYGVCFNCWQYDHQQSNCKRPTLDDHCQNCGRIGVKVNNCPRCRRAYLIYRKKNKIQQTNDVKSSLIKEKVEKEKEEKEKEVERSQERYMSPATLSITEDENLSCEDQLSYDEHYSHEEDPSDDEWDDLNKIIVDESIQSALITSEFLDNFLNLVNAMKYLPAQKRAEIAQNYLLEHRRQLRQESFEE